MDYESCKRALACRLVNVRSGMFYLRHVPFAPAFADMAVTACILTQNRNGENSFLPVTNQMVEEWEMPAGRVLEIARRNMFRILTPRIYPVREIMLSQREGSVLKKVENIVREEYPDRDGRALQLLSAELAEVLCDRYEMQNGIADMWVLGNRDWIFGASGLLYPRVLEKFALTHNDSFYIIPSSLHEAILIPAHAVHSENDLKEMLAITNKKMREKQQFLSDCIYFYDKGKCEIRCL